MSRQYDDLFAALAAPFGQDEVRVRPVKGKDIQYVTARTVMNRLDDVIGPDDWWDDYSPNAHGAICRLTIRLPGGEELTKVDAGGNPEMQDEGDSDKGGFSDAFKRAAVKFGIGRYLYRDGVPAFAGQMHCGQAKEAARPSMRQAPREQAEHQPARSEAQGDRPGIDLFKWASDNNRLNDVKAWAKDNNVRGLIKEWSRETCDAAWEAVGEPMK
jgi:hypothetical protein